MGPPRPKPGEKQVCSRCGGRGWYRVLLFFVRRCFCQGERYRDAMRDPRDYDIDASGIELDRGGHILPTWRCERCSMPGQRANFCSRCGLSKDDSSSIYWMRRGYITMSPSERECADAKLIRLGVMQKKGGENPKPEGARPTPPPAPPKPQSHHVSSDSNIGQPVITAHGHIGIGMGCGLAMDMSTGSMDISLGG